MRLEFGLTRSRSVTEVGAPAAEGLKERQPPRLGQGWADLLERPPDPPHEPFEPAEFDRVSLVDIWPAGDGLRILCVGWRLRRGRPREARVGAFSLSREAFERSRFCMEVLPPTDHDYVWKNGRLMPRWASALKTVQITQPGWYEALMRELRMAATKAAA